MPENDTNGPEIFSPTNTNSDNLTNGTSRVNGDTPSAPLVNSADEPVEPDVPQTYAEPISTAPSAGQTNTTPSASALTPSPAPMPGNNSVPASSAPFSPTGPMPPAKKKWVIPAVAIAAVAVLAGSFFGFKTYTSSASYVWNKSFSNTAEGYDVLSEKLAKIDTKTYKSTDVTGSLKIEADGFSGSGQLKGAMGEKNGEGSFDFSVKVENDGNSVDISAGTDFKYVTSKSKYPDVYVKARGLDKLKNLATSLGGSEAEVQPYIDQFNEKWFVLEGSYIESQTSAYEKMLVGSSDAMANSPKPEEITAFLNSLSGSTKEYLLTADKDKAVITRKEFVGKEKKNGADTNHYKAGINKNNLKAYGKELQKAFVASDLGKWAEKQSDQTAEELFDYEGFTKAVDDIDSNFTMDIWIDTNSKMIQTIRFYDESAGKSYGEISLLYTGGDEVPFQLYINDDTSETDATLKFTYNLDSGKLLFDAAVKDAKSDTNIVWSSAITPRNDEPKVTAPTGATSIQELVNQYSGAMNSQLPTSDPSYDDTSDADFEALMNTYEN